MPYQMTTTHQQASGVSPELRRLSVAQQAPFPAANLLTAAPPAFQRQFSFDGADLFPMDPFLMSPVLAPAHNPLLDVLIKKEPAPTVALQPLNDSDLQTYLDTYFAQQQQQQQQQQYVTAPVTQTLSRAQRPARKTSSEQVADENDDDVEAAAAVEEEEESDAPYVPDEERDTSDEDFAPASGRKRSTSARASSTRRITRIPPIPDLPTSPSTPRLSAKRKRFGRPPTDADAEDELISEEALETISEADAAKFLGDNQPDGPLSTIAGEADLMRRLKMWCILQEIHDDRSEIYKRMPSMVIKKRSRNQLASKISRLKKSIFIYKMETELANARQRIAALEETLSRVSGQVALQPPHPSARREPK